MNAKKGFKITGCNAKTPSLARRRRMEKIVDDFRNVMFSQFTRDSSEEGSLERNGDFTLRNNPVTIDVYFHNIYNGANKVGYLSDNKIQKQMKILNENFSGSQTTNPNDCHGTQKNGVDTQISFQLKTISRTASSSWYSCFQRNEMKIKQSLRKGNCSTLNIYTGDLGGALGFAYFPDVCRNNVVRDGVVIDYRTLPGGSFGKYNLGNTLAHEVGHWLGLYHTFEGGCSDSDRITDTPAEKTPNYGCPKNGRNTCPAAGVDPINNFMDYSDDCCVFEFTSLQITRMHSMINSYRTSSSSRKPQQSKFHTSSLVTQEDQTIVSKEERIQKDTENDGLCLDFICLEDLHRSWKRKCNSRSCSGCAQCLSLDIEQ